MKNIHRLVSLAAVSSLSLVLLAPRWAHAEEAKACFPKCRAGYLCTPEGKCVSECNPPCDKGESCRAGACISEEAATTSSDTRSLEIDWTGGVGVHVSRETAPVLLTSLSFAFGGKHAFLAGVQGGVAFFDTFIGTSTIGEVGLNLGYRGIFTTGDVGVGLLALFQPQIWTGDDPLLGLGGAIGGVVTYKRLVVQVPLGVSRVATFERHFETSEKAVVFTPTVLAGISF